MQSVTLIDNPLEPESWERLEVEDVRALLMERYPEWPERARIYRENVGEDCDVTPRTPADVERLAQYPSLFVVIYPEGPIAIIAAIVVAVVATVALAFLLPSIPDLSNTQTTSPNNGLTERGNRPRPNARIPDIYGTVRSVPDLISVPYRVYEDHRELEIAYFCIGRGGYAIADVRDGDTLVSEINGASAAIYGPYSSPNSGTAPQLQIGTAIGDPLFNVTRLNEVNGQTLKAPNDAAVTADNELSFKDGGIVEAAAGSIDFTDYFEPNDQVDIGRALAAGTGIATPVLLAAGRGVSPASIKFASYDPTAHFKAGQRIRISGAVWTYYDGTPDGGGGSGDIDGGYYYSGYGYYS